jgi:hypothetical protein
MDKDFKLERDTAWSIRRMMLSISCRQYSAEYPKAVMVSNIRAKFKKLCDISGKADAVAIMRCYMKRNPLKFEHS